MHPDVELQFVDWSCYYDDPPDDLDVFVFDSIFLSEFIEKGYLEPFPEDKIPNKEDLVPFAVEGCREGGVLFTSDLAGVNAKISDSKKELSYELVDLLTSEDVLAEAMSPEDKDSSPQYLLPARVSTYERLGSSYPVYGKLEEIVLDRGNRIFRIGSNVREYIANMKKVLPGLVFSEEEASAREEPDGSGAEAMKAMIISDLHYTEYKEADPLLVPGIAVAEEITDAVTAEVIDRHPDVLIMTGDNTNSGYSGDVAALVAKLQKIKEAGISVILITGNHDYDLMEASEIEKAYFGLLDPVDRDPASLSYTAIVKDVVFLAMDDNAVSPGGQGEFSPETMQWISDILAKYKGHQVVFLSHHNVLYGYGEEDSTSHLIQNPELSDLLREGGVKLAMTGHMHFPYITQEDGLWEILSGMPFSGEHLIGNLEIGEDRIAYYAEPIDFETYGSDVREELERLDVESAAYMEEILSGLLEKEGVYGAKKKKVLKLIEKFLLCYSGGTLAEHAQEIREDPSYDLMIKGLWNYNYGPWMKAMIETTRYSGRELEITLE